MFIGHFAVGLGSKKISPEVSLGTTFMAAQFLDLVWPVLVIFGIEEVQVDHSATVFTPLNFVSYPYSHSLLMAFFWSLLFGGIYFLFKKNKKTAIVLGAVVLSHWILDFLTHRPDLPLGLFNGSKVGLGLWNSIWATVAIEGLLFVSSIFLYLKHSPLKHPIRFWSLIVFLVLVYLGNAFGPKPSLETPGVMIAGPALAMWLIVLWGYWADRRS